MRGRCEYDLCPLVDRLGHRAVKIAVIGGEHLHAHLARQPRLKILAPVLVRARPCAVLRVEGVDERDVQMLRVRRAYQL